MAATSTWAPTREELDEATDWTAEVNRVGSRADAERAAENEKNIHEHYLQRDGADRELQREAERELEAG